MKKIKLGNKMYNLVSKGANGSCVEISSTQIAKVFELGSASREANLMKKANSINGLVCQYIDITFTETFSHELLVMERLYPLQYRALSVKEREEMFEKFIVDLKELHSNGFAHWDIKRPEHVATGERLWDNIILTKEGLRLIDTGNSLLEGDPDFEEAVQDDINSAMEFKEIFLIP
jgi:tRNA A-37 threonylcarbamoyl transferase component Bud32